MGCFMKTAHLSIYYQSLFTHKLGEFLDVTVQVKDNPYGLSAESLYEMAARINKKRSFLFVSKVLGKHIPLNPHLPLIVSSLLATMFYEDQQQTSIEEKEVLIQAVKNSTTENVAAACSMLKQINYSLNEPTLFIGFAETATALGHAVFDCFSEASYIHSTREMIANKEVTLNFEEEHSHATAQRCYASEEYLANNRPICLVDDEITTGKTALNIIASIQKKYPRKEYNILSILDWRTEEDRLRFQQFEEQWGIQIICYSLLSGTIQVQGAAYLPEETEALDDSYSELPDYHCLSLRSFQSSIPLLSYSSVDSCGIHNDSPYFSLTGRFGLTADHRQDLSVYCQQVGDYVRSFRKGTNTLCLGTGEFMYIPMKVATHMGEGVVYHSTTRSPILPINEEGYPIKNALAFQSPDDPTVINYAYNVLAQHYDEVFLFFERTMEEARLLPLLRQFSHISTIHIVYFT
ncbi:hypothetical protein CD798_11485 [Bacillaceae bacterium SAOS 7]|nr:hypothetical protein CD798_11485 [Bacillaceae bacterium SAOS 7]